MLCLWKNIGLTSIEVSSSVRSLGECVSARWPKDTIDQSAQGKSPCEDDISEGLVDGRVEGRTGVHVKSEVVLKCEGNNNEGVCDMLCQT